MAARSRLLPAAQPKLVTPVLQVVRRVITRFLLKQAGVKAPKPQPPMEAPESVGGEHPLLTGTVTSAEGEADARDQPSTPLARKAPIKVAVRPAAAS